MPVSSNKLLANYKLLVMADKVLENGRQSIIKLPIDKMADYTVVIITANYYGKNCVLSHNCR